MLLLEANFNKWKLCVNFNFLGQNILKLETVN